MKNSKKFGFTILELVISVGIFSVLMVLTADIFRFINEGQRTTLINQSTQESLRFMLEVMSKDFRQAILMESDCDGIWPGYTASNRLYDLNGASDQVYFKNKYGDCVSYYLDSGTLMKSVNGYNSSTTPDEIVVSNLGFTVKGNTIGTAIEDLIQPLITFKMHFEYDSDIDRYKKPIDIQTSVSSRYYE